MLSFLAIAPGMTVVIPVPVVWAMAAVIAVGAVLLTLHGRKQARAEAPVAAPVPVAAPAVAEGPRMAPGAAGRLKLHNVEPKAAAMVMAIVADKLQKPLNELRFISIKEV